jgi:hypothetical protein
MNQHPKECFFHDNSCRKRGNDDRRISAGKGAILKHKRMENTS